MTMVALLLLAAPAESSRRSSSSRDWAYALAIQKDGKLVVAGLGGIARYTTNGRLDQSFRRGGKVLTQGFVAKAIAIQPDARIIAGGEKKSDYRVGRLVRLTATGRLDPSFGRGGSVQTGFGAEAIALQADGKIVAGGGALARYTRRGRLDSTSFGRGGKVTPDFGVSALALQPDGRIVVCGGLLGGRIALARYTADGTRDASFGKGGKVVITFEFLVRGCALAIQPDGDVIAAAVGFDYDSDFALARFSAQGVLDSGFGDGGKVLTNFGPDPNQITDESEDSAFAAAIQRDGKIVAAGFSDVKGLCDDMGHSCRDFALVRYTADGSLDGIFGRDGKVLTHFVAARSHVPSSSIGQAVVIQSDGKIVVAGLGAGYDFALARYTPGGRLDPSFGRGGKVLTDLGSG
jgi:uncharacterized delta-60 repeat protein